MTTEKYNSQLAWLLQRDLREKDIPALGKEPWITVYLNKITENVNLGIFSALIPNSCIETALSHICWDFHIGNGHPACMVSYKDGEKQVNYLRFGNSDEIEPFVIHRDFHGIRKSYNEIIEEFRHYHNLYHDLDRNQLLKFDDRGDETVVAKIELDRVEVRLKEIRQFLAMKKMHLAIYFDSKRYSELLPNELPISLDHQDDLTHYSIRADYENFSFKEDYKSFSYLLGKKLITPLPIEQSRIWPFSDKEENCVEFVIGLDEDGSSEISYSCNPDKLANYFGANPDAPNYLTPVFFRREVLTKYYAHPERYSVEDGFLRCKGLWGIQIDNNHHDYIIVFLGDLGRDLPSEEQLYWRSYNVPPEGKISKVNFKRSFLSEATDPEQIDLVFKSQFKTFSKNWHTSKGWFLFLPLAEADQHLFKALHIPLTNSQQEFDSQVLALTKLMIDSLNEKEIIKAISEPLDSQNIKGISKFEHFLKQSLLPDYQKHIQFLRNLQELRSTGVGHRKGKSYDKIASSFGLKEGNRASVFTKILIEATELITELEKYFLQ
jgi:hypothetical protein